LSIDCLLQSDFTIKVEGGEHAQARAGIALSHIVGDFAVVASVWITGLAMSRIAFSGN
jgi:hypothetical protein